MIHQLVYFSRNTVPGDDRAMLTNLREILAVAQRNNVRDGITGFLIFDKTWFFQILEGERLKVTETYTRIARDTRHSGASIMNARDVTDRSFPDWSMGGAMRSVDVQEIYLQHGIGSSMDPSKLNSAKVLHLAMDLQAFDVAKRQGQRRAG